MHHLYLDPYLFACPIASKGQDGFDAFLQGILMLSEIRDSAWARMFISASTTDLLFKEKRYPLQNDLRAAIETFGVKEEIQARDVIDIVNSFLQRLPTLEDYLEISDLIIDKFDTEPMINFVDRGQNLIDGFIRVLVLGSLGPMIKSYGESGNMSLAAGLEVADKKVLVRSTISMIDGVAPFTLPYNSESSCWVCQSWDDLCRCVDLEKMWLSGSKDGVCRTVIEMALAIEGGGGLRSGVVRWWFGKRFLETAEALGFLHESTKVKMILRSCVEVILQKNPRATHALRTGNGGNNPQLVRGQKKAWRRDIDYEFHLHYWETPSGIELAAIVTHNDYNIP